MIYILLKNKNYIFSPRYNICVPGEWNYYSSGSLGTNNNMSQMMVTQTISNGVGYHQRMTHELQTIVATIIGAP